MKETMPPLNIVKGSELPQLAFVGNKFNADSITVIKQLSMITRYPLFNKPHGGLWLSPIKHDTMTTWEHWCHEEQFNLDRMMLSLSPDTRIIIGTYDDLLALKTHHSIANLPDWDTIQEKYDGVYLTDNGNNVNISQARQYEFNIGLWDMESMLVFKKACKHLTIESTEKITEQ